MKRTPLYAAHQRLGGKLIEFGGWEMPVQYTSIVEEHRAVRQGGGCLTSRTWGKSGCAAPARRHF